MILIDDLRPWLDASDVSHDALMVAIEAGVVDGVQRDTGYYFGPVASTTEIVIGDGGPKLRLRALPVAVTGPPAVAALPATVAERCYPGDDATTITAADDDGYELRSLADPTTPPLAWLVRKAGGIWGRGVEYTVTYNRGYDAGEEPASIRQLVIGLCKLEWERWKSKGGVYQSETFDRHSYRMADLTGTPDWMRDTLSAWQVPVW